jgi:hypothetical protein
MPLNIPGILAPLQFVWNRSVRCRKDIHQLDLSAFRRAPWFRTDDEC